MKEVLSIKFYEVPVVEVIEVEVEKGFAGSQNSGGAGEGYEEGGYGEF